MGFPRQLHRCAPDFSRAIDLLIDRAVFLNDSHVSAQHRPGPSQASCERFSLRGLTIGCSVRTNRQSEHAGELCLPANTSLGKSLLEHSVQSVDPSFSLALRG